MKRFLLLAMIFVFVALACASAFASADTYYPARKNTGSTDTTYASYYTMSALGASSATCMAPGIAPGYRSYYVSSNVPVVGVRNATWAIPLQQWGYYDVYVTWASATSAKTNAKYIVTDKFGATTYFHNQQVNVDTWQSLGTHEFDANSASTTKIVLTNDNQSTSGNLYATALWFHDATPTGPATLTATSTGTAVDLSWPDLTPAAASFTIERKEGIAGTYSEIATGVSGLAYTDSDNVPDIEYYYHVKGITAGGLTTRWSPEAHAYKSIGSPPPPATGPSPADGASIVHTDLTGITVPGSLSWDTNASTATMDVYFGTDPTPITKVSSDQTGVTFAPGELTANTDYYWQIVRKNPGGSTAGPIWHFKTGVSLTVSPIRSANRGTIDYPVGKPWGEKTWHEAGEVITLAVSATDPAVWQWWSLNADGTRSVWADPPYPADWDLNSTIGDESGALQGFVIPTTNTTLYAVYAGPRFTVTTEAIPVAGGTIAVTDQTWPSALMNEFETNDVAHIVATPAAGYKFAGWVADAAGAFANEFATDTTFPITANTKFTAYFAKANSNIVSNGCRTIASGDLEGTYDDWWTSQVNIVSYTTANTLGRPNEVYARVMARFPNTIPALSLRNGLAKVMAMHTNASSYSGTYNATIHAYPVLTPWTYSTTAAGATWNTTDGTTPWTNKGGDYDQANELGSGQIFAGTGGAAPGTWHTWKLNMGVDYRTLLANGVEFKGDEEGLLVPAYPLAYRKGFGFSGANLPTLNFFYDPPTGANSGVIKDWAYLGFFPDAAANQVRIDTDQVAGTYNGVPVDVTYLAPKVGNALGAYTWKAGSSATDLIDLLGAGFYNAANANGVTYCATYVYNPGADLTYYIGLGSDDYSKTWLDTSARAFKSVAEGVGYDQAFQGPFTMTTGWHRLIAKVENGTTAHGLYLRLANVDRTALTGIETLQFATTDATAPTNPTSVTTAGTWDNPVFSFVGATDPQGAGEGVSNVRGFKVYFGTDPAGVPATWQAGSTYTPAGPLAPGTYYLRVKAVDTALNESATIADVATYSATSPFVASYGLNNKAVKAAIMGTAAANYKFTVWGLVTVIDANSFTVDDGSGTPVKVIFAAHGFTGTDYVSATGTLDVSGAVPVLTALSVKKQN